MLYVFGVSTLHLVYIIHCRSTAPALHFKAMIAKNKKFLRFNLAAVKSNISESTERHVHKGVNERSTQQRSAESQKNESKSTDLIYPASPTRVLASMCSAIYLCGHVQIVLHVPQAAAPTCKLSCLFSLIVLTGWLYLVTLHKYRQRLSHFIVVINANTAQKAKLSGSTRCDRQESAGANQSQNQS